MAAKKHHRMHARITAILVSALAGCTTPPSFIPEWTVTWTEWNWSRPGATQSQLNTEFAACEGGCSWTFLGGKAMNWGLCSACFYILCDEDNDRAAKNWTGAL